jgi:hypothetical protein
LAADKDQDKPAAGQLEGTGFYHTPYVDAQQISQKQAAAARPVTAATRILFAADTLRRARLRGAGFA